MPKIKEMLPKEFFEYMKTALLDEYDDFVGSLNDIPFRGLRVNRLLADDELVKNKLNINMKKTPFCDNGYYIDNALSGLGNNPLHHAGAFYLQEPSAMSAVTALDVQKGDIVLDLCAAPGGKSTQIAEKLNGEGLLVSNEIVAQRAKILASNIERLGIKNAIVTNSMPNVICNELCGFFDKVLVDAPCSGEGMLRREPAAVREWALENHEMCKNRTKKILDDAANAVKSGGIMVYSTCTLSIEENEQTIDEFLNRHPEFELCEINAQFGMSAFSRHCDNNNIAKARRILYKHGGEGHFVAKLKKADDFVQNRAEICENKPEKLPLVNEFFSKYFNDLSDVEYAHSVGENIYIYPKIMPKMKKTRIIKAGIMAGKLLKNRFEPSHDLYKTRRFSEHKNIIDLSVNSNEIKRFLHGEVIECDKVGYTAVAVEGVVTGFGKASNGQLKNHYPKGLRTL